MTAPGRASARRLLAGLAAAGWLAVPAAAAEAEHAPITGTGVSLVVPEGFRVADAFPGIGRDEDTTSLLVTELDVPVALSRPRLDGDALAAQGIEALRSAEVRVAGREGWLVHGVQRAAGVRFRKWILLFGDERRSVLLTATTPLDLEPTHRDALVRTLRTARWDPGTRFGSDGALPFRIPEVPALSVVRSSPRAVVLAGPAEEGRLPPLVTVGVSRVKVQIRDLAGFARRRLDESASIDGIRIEQERSRALDGMPGHWILARATDTENGRPVVVTQLVATDGDRYFLVQGIAEEGSETALAPKLDALLEGFRRAR